MATINPHIKDFLRNEYLPWALSHKKFISNKQINILAQFMPSKSFQIPDYKLSRFCVFFHHALIDAIDSKPIDAQCFAQTYCKAQIKMHLSANPESQHFDKNIKALSERIELTPQAISLKAHNFIQKVWSASQGNYDANVRAYDLSHKISSVKYNGIDID